MKRKYRETYRILKSLPALQREVVLSSTLRTVLDELDREDYSLVMNQISKLLYVFDSLSFADCLELFGKFAIYKYAKEVK